MLNEFTENIVQEDVCFIYYVFHYVPSYEYVHACKQ